VFLIGPRRYGKTSILKAVEDKLQVANSVVFASTPKATLPSKCW
jgi:AAA+ ATPase superfamily predicted ATPase